MPWRGVATAVVIVCLGGCVSQEAVPTDTSLAVTSQAPSSLVPSSLVPSSLVPPSPPSTSPPSTATTASMTTTIPTEPVPVAVAMRTDPLYGGHDWISHPGPYLFHSIHFLGSDGESQMVRFVAEPTEACGQRGGLLSVVLTIRFDEASADLAIGAGGCPEMPAISEIADAIDAAGGRFTWSADESSLTLTGGGFGLAFSQEVPPPTQDWYPIYQLDMIDPWEASIGPELAGEWSLLEVDGAEPPEAVPMSIGDVGLSFRSCNYYNGSYFVTATDQIGFRLFATTIGCGEDDVYESSSGPVPVADVTLDLPHMTWDFVDGGTFLWVRKPSD